MPKIKAQIGEIGISVIISTNRPNSIENIFSNFNNQKWQTKELLIVLNNDLMNLSEWREQAEANESVSVYQLPESEFLGACLSLAVNKAKYDYIAKFDDDDYYSPYYLTEAMQVFKKTNADLIGKRSYYMYMIDKKLLMLRHPSKENRWCPLIGGGTIIAKKEVFQKVPLVNRQVGTAFQFVIDSRKKGFRIYSSSRFNYTYIRNTDTSHTWNPGQEYFFKTSKKIAVTDDYRSYVNPPIRQ